MHLAISDILGVSVMRFSDALIRIWFNIVVPKNSLIGPNTLKSLSVLSESLHRLNRSGVDLLMIRVDLEWLNCP